MSSTLDLEEQIWMLAEAEFAQTTPVVFVPHSPRQGRRWFGAAVVALAFAVVGAAQLGLVASVTQSPGTDGGGESVSIGRTYRDPSDIEWDIPPAIRSSRAELSGLTRGDLGLALAYGSVFVTTDRGLSWQAPGPLVADVGPFQSGTMRGANVAGSCPDIGNLATMHGDEFALLGLSSDQAPGLPPRKSVYLSANAVDWEELQLPRAAGTGDATTCGLASDGDRLVVARSVGLQIEVLTHFTGTPRSEDAFAAVRLEGAVATVPNAVGVHHHDGQWLTSACVATGFFEGPVCALEVWNISGAMGVSPKVPAVVVGRSVDRIDVTDQGIWLSGVEELLADVPDTGEPIRDLLAADGLSFEFGNVFRGVAGRPWAQLVAADVTTAREVDIDAAALPVGLSSAVRIRQVGGETFAVATARRSHYGGTPDEVWLLHTDGAWVETEPVSPRPWAESELSGRMVPTGWSPGTGVLVWPVDDIDVPVEAIEHELIDLARDEYLLDAASIGHVELGLRSSVPSLVYRAGLDGDWRVLDTEQGFGIEDAVECVAAIGQDFFMQVRSPDRSSVAVYMSADALAWTRLPNRVLAGGDLCG